MARLLGSNIKVHFAGAEQADHALVARAAGVKYYLYTVLPFICGKFGIKGFPSITRSVFAPKEVEAFSKHVIMDSGLFSLMFGAHRGKRSYEFIMQWQTAMVEFVKENSLTATCVECDCQKLLGSDAAWRIRELFKSQLPHNRQINVFHIEDGKYGLDRLIEFSEYIAISVPEIRIVKRSGYKDATYRLAAYVKNKKPSIDIHLLGCTERVLLERCRFCTSSDSTSWLSANRYGRIMSHRIWQLDDKAMVAIRPIAERILAECKRTSSEKAIANLSRTYISAVLHRRLYERICGDQS